MPIERTPNGTRGTVMPGGKLLKKVLEPLAERHVIRLTPVSGS